MLHLFFVVLFYTISIANGQLLSNYELEFLDSGIYKPCSNYPDNFVDKLFDMSKVQIEQTEDGSVIIKGTSVMMRSVEPPQPILVEVYKKERGEWLQTQYTQRRIDLCTACYDEKELWHGYLKNTPKEQLKCPFIEGQTVDFDVNEPTLMTTPMRNVEGEYNFHVEVGNKTGDFFICADIFALVHKV